MPLSRTAMARAASAFWTSPAASSRPDEHREVLQRVVVDVGRDPGALGLRGGDDDVALERGPIREPEKRPERETVAPAGSPTSSDQERPQERIPGAKHQKPPRPPPRGPRARASSVDSTNLPGAGADPESSAASFRKAGRAAISPARRRRSRPGLRSRSYASPKSAPITKVAPARKEAAARTPTTRRDSPPGGVVEPVAEIGRQGHHPGRHHDERRDQEMAASA